LIIHIRYELSSQGWVCADGGLREGDNRAMGVYIKENKIPLE